MKRRENMTMTERKEGRTYEEYGKWYRKEKKMMKTKQETEAKPDRRKYETFLWKKSEACHENMARRARKEMSDENKYDTMETSNRQRNKSNNSTK